MTTASSGHTDELYEHSTDAADNELLWVSPVNPGASGYFGISTPSDAPNKIKVRSTIELRVWTEPKR